MNVDLTKLTDALEQCEEKHKTTLKGKSGKSADFEEGFVRGLFYVREYIVPAFETVEIDEALAIETHMQEQIDNIKLLHGINDDPLK